MQDLGLRVQDCMKCRIGYGSWRLEETSGSMRKFYEMQGGVSWQPPTTGVWHRIEGADPVPSVKPQPAPLGLSQHGTGAGNITHTPLGW